MKKSIQLIVTAFVSTFMFVQCGSQNSEETTIEENASETESKKPTLTMLWETPDSLFTNESVLYDESTGTIYVSNIEGQDPNGKDGKGSIGIISKDGKIVNASWVSGLNAPKGMGIANGKLYVTDIDELVEIDIASAKVSKKYKVDSAIFLNDLAIQNNKVYFSDSRTGKVHLFDAGSVSTFSNGNEGINGLEVAADGTLYGLDGSGLKKWNTDGSSSIINANIKGGDGLVILKDGNFIASKWQGEIWFANDTSQTLMLDTKEAESNTADIGFIPAENIVLVPTFFKNKVVAYKLDY
ncbi:MAG: ATP-binding protein [Chitinophagaceae bacterium]|nr:ATP-binding protein [Chitinophagaceae bacterium]